MIPDFVKSILSSGVFRARVLKVINGASLAAGAWTLSHMYDWLTTHATYFSQADSMAIAGTVSAAVAGLILTVGSAIYSQLDVSKVNAKIVTAAVTGSVEAANNPDVRKAVTAASGSPEALQQVIATLKAGGE